MFHSIVNPFIYYSQNKRIHEAVNYLLSYLPCFRSLSHISPITMNFTEENTGNTKCSKNGAQAVRIVNMVAYMPVTAGKNIQLKSNSTANNNKENDVIYANIN